MVTNRKSAFNLTVRRSDSAKGQPRKIAQSIKIALGFDAEVTSPDRGVTFAISLESEEQVRRIREMLDALGLIEPAAPKSTAQPKDVVPFNVPNKPYDFVPLPAEFTFGSPVWHDGTSSAGRISGEIRFEIDTMSPLLVGCERGTVGDLRRSGAAAGLEGALDGKPVLAPLRAPWGRRPVLLPGDSLKGLLRHELGALLGAPMERVAERSYSYRPNATYPSAKDRKPVLVPRIARVPANATEKYSLRIGGEESVDIRVPTELELFAEDLQIRSSNTRLRDGYQFDPADGSGKTYRGGLGAGQALNSRRELRARMHVLPDSTTKVGVDRSARTGYVHTIRHLLDADHGHFSSRHPDVVADGSEMPADSEYAVRGDEARHRIKEVASGVAFAPGDYIWVEWDTRRKRIVSFGWHYYYRWAYQDTVRYQVDDQTGERTRVRHGLAATPEELDSEARQLTAVRRLFGYVAGNVGFEESESADRSDPDVKDHSQLMGRISINAAVEMVPPELNDDDRFIPRTFLRELGMPRPSAVEFYLDQTKLQEKRPKDNAELITYGDARGIDRSGDLKGRKFYLDRPDAHRAYATGSHPWEDDSDENKRNKRSTVAVDALNPGAKLRFTLRFRDLDEWELAAALLAFCPHQFKDVVGGSHRVGYCSKLGYARPLGWGTVRITADSMFLLGTRTSELDKVGDLLGWFTTHFRRTSQVDSWLGVHRHRNPQAADYPRDRNGEIPGFHSALRSDHSRERRYERE